MKIKTLYKSLGENELMSLLDKQLKILEPPLQDWLKNFTILENKRDAIKYAKKNYVSSYANYLGFTIEIDVEEENYTELVKNIIRKNDSKIEIPLELLEDFNKLIIGKIRITDVFIGVEFQESSNLEIKKIIQELLSKKSLTREEFTSEILDFIYKFNQNYNHKASHIYLDDPTKMILSMYVRYKRICSIFEFTNIKIDSIQSLLDFNYLDNQKKYKFDKELIALAEDSLGNFYNLDNIKFQDIKLTIQKILDFRNGYKNLLDNFFGGVRLEGAIPIDQRLATTFVISSIKDIDTLVERINKIVASLLFPDIIKFNIPYLIENFNFPEEDFEALEIKEYFDYWNDI